MSANPAILGYRRFLRDRDGDPDIHRDTLSRREEFFRRIEEKPIRSAQTIDRELFLRNLAKRRAEPGLDDRMLWLVATAKANQSERFGVELGKLFGRIPSEEEGPEFVHVVLQETYHTRILADVIAIFGLPVPRHPPDLLTRLFIEFLVFNPLPRRLALPLVGLSEMVGCVMFKLLRDRGVELFADEPEVAEQIRLLYDEILADEICHVGLIESQLGRFGRALMRGLYRGLGLRMISSMGPETLALIGRERFAAATRAPFDRAALAAEFPHTAYAF